MRRVKNFVPTATKLTITKKKANHNTNLDPPSAEWKSPTQDPWTHWTPSIFITRRADALTTSTTALWNAPSTTIDTLMSIDYRSQTWGKSLSGERWDLNSEIIAGICTEFSEPFSNNLSTRFDEWVGFPAFFLTAMTLLTKLFQIIFYRQTSDHIEKAAIHTIRLNPPDLETRK